MRNKNLIYTYTKAMYVAFFILLIITLILTLPIYVKMYFHFCITENSGYIIIKLFNLKIINYKIIFKNKKILLYNKNNIKKIDFDLNKEHINFVNELQKELFKRIFLDKLKICVDIGIKNNPFVVSMITGLFKGVLNILYGYISFQKPTSLLQYKFNTYYETNVGIVNVEIFVGISLLNTIFSLIKSKLNCYKKKLKEVKKNEIQSRTN